MMAQIYNLRATLTDWEARVRGYPYRVLAVPDDTSLYDLALAINKSFDFDFDHAFGFYDDLKNPYRAQERYELFADMDDLDDPDDVDDVDDVDDMDDLDDEEVEDDLAADLGLDLGLDEDAELEVRAMVERVEALTEGLSPDEAKRVMIETALEDVPEAQRDEARSMIEDFMDALEEDDEGAEARGVKTTPVREAFSEVGKRLLYLFDYGDEWRFVVRLEGTGEPEPGKRYPLLVKAVGEAPEQYPDWDEEDDEDWDEEDEALDEEDEDWDEEDDEEEAGAAKG